MNKELAEASQPHGLAMFQGQARPRYWICVIGPIPDNKLPYGADFPPRRSAIEAVEKMAGESNFDCWSGWAEQDEFERVQDARYRLSQSVATPTQSGENNKPL